MTCDLLPFHFPRTGQKARAEEMDEEGHAVRSVHQGANWADRNDSSGSGQGREPRGDSSHSRRI